MTYRQNSLKSIMISLIKSIDFYNFLLKSHHRRTAIIAYALANQHGLSRESTRDLVLAASVHDIGVIHVKERDELIMADVDYPEPHQILGESILKSFRPFEKISKIIRYHHVHYQDVKNNIIDPDEVPLESYFIHLADRIDILMMMHNDSKEKISDVISMIRERIGTIFAPFLEETFEKVVQSRDFWASIDNLSFHDLLISNIEDEFFSINFSDMDELALIFARMVDSKSKWTSVHSQAVSAISYNIGLLMNKDRETCFKLKIAGYLHDIGKIGIPSELLDKTGSLDEEELQIVKQHALYSFLILSSINGFQDITRWASNHHEKRDRSGYPLHINSFQFCTEMDILAYSDIFSALAEDRPYRKGQSPDAILKVLRQMAPQKLSEDVFKIIESNFDQLYHAYAALN